MKVVLYTNSISAHQLPLAREIVKRVGADNFRYIYTGDLIQGGAQEVSSPEPWIIKDDNSTVDLHLQPTPTPSPISDRLESCDLLLSGNRALPLFERRAAKGLKTYYQSERWFKPILIEFKVPLFTFTSHLHLSLPGWLRMLIPSYRRMAKGFVHWLNIDPNARYLAMGPWAKKDMLKLGVNSDKIVDWGYFVEEGAGDKVKVKGEGEQRNNSALQLGLHTSTNTVKVLWVGRLLDWKRVDTLIRAVALLNSQLSTLNPQPSTSSTPLHLYTAKKYTLTIVGDGPEKPHLQKLANSFVHLLSPPTFSFQPNIPITQVRKEMRKHDVYVLASNAMEGWGAALSEALSEGMVCFGTYEAGASAALLPDSQLFHAGDYKALAKKISALQLHLSTTTIPKGFTPKGAAEWLLNT